MRVCIAGSRGLNVPLWWLQKVLETCVEVKDVETILNGDCPRGIDQCAVRLADKLKITVECFTADWDKFGLSAGPKRNAEMAKCADFVLVVWDGMSAGSRSMISAAIEESKPVMQVVVTPRFVEWLWEKHG